MKVGVATVIGSRGFKGVTGGGDNGAAYHHVTVIVYINANVHVVFSRTDGEFPATGGHKLEGLKRTSADQAVGGAITLTVDPAVECAAGYKEHGLACGYVTVKRAAVDE